MILIIVSDIVNIFFLKENFTFHFYNLQIFLAEVELFSTNFKNRESRLQSPAGLTISYFSNQTKVVQLYENL